MRLFKPHENYKPIKSTELAAVPLLEGGEVEILGRAEILDRSCRELLQLVAIDLEITENAQEIFETLNARGVVLTAADLIKNFVFQRLLEQKNDVEEAYERYWKLFETPFWIKEISYGRVKIQRSSLFINHWLIAKTGEEVLNREIFSSFKNYTDFEARLPMLELIRHMHSAAVSYQEVLEVAENKEALLGRVELFAYRLNSMELDVLRPTLIALIDPTETSIPREQLEKAVSVIESWMIRRLLVRVTGKAYNKLVVEMVQIIKKERKNAGDRLEKYFADQRSASSYWPDDSQFKNHVSQMQIYRILYKSRIRMILEAIEDDQRGWKSNESSKSGMRIRRGSFVIEHIMPQSWEANWPLENYDLDSRQAQLQTIGNLTLLSTKLNSSVSNGPWTAKSSELTKHDVLLMNKEIQEHATHGWNEETIAARTLSLIDSMISIWPTPVGHKSRLVSEKPQKSVTVTVNDLISAGLVSAGQSLYPKQHKHAGKLAQILDDGRIAVEGSTVDSLSAAGEMLRMRRPNGWTFWLVDEKTRKSMADLRLEYRDSIGLEEVEGEEEVDEDAEEE